MDFSSAFPMDSRVWVYQADRKLSETEKNWISEQLPQFTNEWNAHGTKLNSYARVISDYHVFFAVNPETMASGCSIDSSVRFVKSLEKELDLSFFNRLKMLIEENGNTQFVPFSELGNHSEALVFNNSVQTLEEFGTKWKQKVADYLK
jgi:hypothetical protein